MEPIDNKDGWKEGRLQQWWDFLGTEMFQKVIQSKAIMNSYMHGQNRVGPVVHFGKH